jgi:hypothetical protein
MEIAAPVRETEKLGVVESPDHVFWATIQTTKFRQTRLRMQAGTVRFCASALLR